MIGLKTENNNLIVTNGKKTAYVTSELRLLREATWKEFIWLASTILYDYPLQENDTFNDFLALLKDGDDRIIQIADETVLNELSEDFEIIELYSEVVDNGNVNDNEDWIIKYFVKLTRNNQILYGWYKTYCSNDIFICTGCGYPGDHGYEKGVVIQGDKIIGLTRKEFEHGREIFVY